MAAGTELPDVPVGASLPTSEASGASATVGVPLDDSSVRFLNRETSWLDFDARVLRLAERDDVPLLERAKFLAIS